MIFTNLWVFSSIDRPGGRPVRGVTLVFKLFRFLRPYRLSVASVLVLIFLQSLSTLYLPTLMSHIVDTGIIQGNIPYILQVGGVMLAVSIGAMVCSVAASYFASRVSVGFGRSLRADIFAHVENFTLHEFDQLGTSSLITRTTNDITHVQQLVNMMLRMMVMAPMTAIGGIIMAVSTDAKLSLVIVVVMPVLAAVIFVILKQGIGLFRSMQTKIDQLNRVLREKLIGVRVVRAFNRVEYEERRFDAANRDLTDTATRVNQIMASLMPMMMVIINFASIGIIWFGSIRVNNGDMQVGSLMAFLQYVMQILFAVLMVSMMFFMFPRASASAARINEVLDTVPDRLDEGVEPDRDHAGALPSPVSDGPHTGQGVTFRNVTFRYPGAEQPALSDISFHAAPGQVTAIIGGTGAGKSTLVGLLPRFYDVERGSIAIDGVDIRTLSVEALRSKIGFVPQQAVLFTGSIVDNIRYGNDEADEEAVRHAADVAQATEFIHELDARFESRISQGGRNLSGGQKQRLAIARALVRRPDIYVFDDSFSALDFKTDAKLRAALKSETRDATVIIVAQRVNTVMDADQIIVMDEGRIVGAGRHNELMTTCQVYGEIVSSQLSEEAGA